MSGARGSCCVVLVRVGAEMGRGPRAEPSSALAALAPVAKFHDHLLFAVSIYWIFE